MKKLDNLRTQTNHKDIPEILKILSREFPNKILFTTSFGVEDQVITDYIFKNDIPIRVVAIVWIVGLQAYEKTKTKTEHLCK